ncbi:MAG: hypothetical protein O2930_14985, partial [Acidobacteria bacterium]|nr:hypothetical protein [Acidobacteriota bacterium]
HHSCSTSREEPPLQFSTVSGTSPFKSAATIAKVTNCRVLTDVTGDFNRVVLEYEVENLGAFEAHMKEYATNEAFREQMKGYTDLYVTGSREFLQLA